MGTLIFLALVFGVMYMLIIRPNQRRMKEHRDLLAGLEVGDVVVTSSGIHGAVAEIEETVVWLEVARLGRFQLIVVRGFFVIELLDHLGDR